MTNKNKFSPDPKLKLMDQLREVLRYHHYAYRTEQSYCDWIDSYVKFRKIKKYLKDMGKKDIDFGMNLIYIQAAKGGKYRTKVFSKTIQRDLRNQIQKVKLLHKEDLANGYGDVYLPEVLARKYTIATKQYV